MGITFKHVVIVVILYSLIDWFLIRPLRKKMGKSKEEVTAKSLNLQPQIKDNRTIYSGVFNGRRTEFFWAEDWLSIRTFFGKGYRVANKAEGDLFDYLEKSPGLQNIYKSFNDPFSSIGLMCVDDNVDSGDTNGIDYMTDKKIMYNENEIRKKLEMLSQILDYVENNFKVEKI